MNVGAPDVAEKVHARNLEPWKERQFLLPDPGAHVEERITQTDIAVAIDIRIAARVVDRQPRRRGRVEFQARRREPKSHATRRIDIDRAQNRVTRHERSSVGPLEKGCRADFESKEFGIGVVIPKHQRAAFALDRPEARLALSLLESGVVEEIERQISAEECDMNDGRDPYVTSSC